MLNRTDYMCWLCREYDFKWEPMSGRLISRGVPGYTPDKELGYFKSIAEVYDRLAPLLTTTDFTDRYLRVTNS